MHCILLYRKRVQSSHIACRWQSVQSGATHFHVQTSFNVYSLVFVEQDTRSFLVIILHHCCEINSTCLSIVWRTGNFFTSLWFNASISLWFRKYTLCFIKQTITFNNVLNFCDKLSGSFFFLYHCGSYFRCGRNGWGIPMLLFAYHKMMSNSVHSLRKSWFLFPLSGVWLSYKQLNLYLNFS